jgi:ATP-dependent DNA helicase RecG
MLDIQNLLRAGEGKTVEFKRDLSSPKGILKTLIAFSNTAGGSLILGVEDQTKHIVGIECPFTDEEKIANLIYAHITPQILPEIQIIPWKNFYLLMIQVFPSATKPHYLKTEGPEKGTYIRVGSTNRLADLSMQAELKRVNIIDSFDKQPCLESGPEALDFKAISETFTTVKQITSSDLSSLDLIILNQGKKVPSVGGMILFGQERLKFFPDAWIQVGRFQGITKTKIFDTQALKGYPIFAIDQAMDFVKKHSMHGVDLSTPEESLKHKKTWSLPLIAVREALINAVVHADYAQQGSPIRLSIFDDRIEIENPGLLLFGLTVEEIKQGVSKLRNRVIGQIFYRLGLIERWGSGISRIIDSCRELGFPQPLFEEIGTHFRVTLKTQRNKNVDLHETDQAILSTLEKQQEIGISTKELSEIIGKSTRMTRLRLTALIQKGWIIGIGSGPTDPQKRYFLTSSAPL